MKDIFGWLKRGPSPDPEVQNNHIKLSKSEMVIVLLVMCGVVGTVIGVIGVVMKL